MQSSKFWYCSDRSTSKAISRRTEGNLGKFSNKRSILEDLYVEVSSVLKENEFESLYNKAIGSNEHGALIIDLTGNKKRFYNNLEKEYLL